MFTNLDILGASHCSYVEEPEGTADGIVMPCPQNLAVDHVLYPLVILHSY